MQVAVCVRRVCEIANEAKRVFYLLHRCHPASDKACPTAEMRTTSDVRLVVKGMQRRHDFPALC